MLLLAVVVEWPIIIIICWGLSGPEYFLGCWFMMTVSLLSEVLSSFLSLVCSRSELDEELLRFGIAGPPPAMPLQPPRSL